MKLLKRNQHSTVKTFAVVLLLLSFSLAFHSCQKELIPVGASISTVTKIVN